MEYFTAIGFLLSNKKSIWGGGVNILRVNIYHYDNSARNWNLYDQLQDLKFIGRNFKKNVMTEMIERKMISYKTSMMYRNYDSNSTL